MAWNPILQTGASGWQPTLTTKPAVSREPAPYVPDFSSGVGGFSGTTPQTTRADTGRLLLDIGQATARGYASVGKTVLTTITGEGSKTDMFSPQAPYERILFGNEPFNAQTVGEEYGFLPKGSAYAPALGFAGVALDVSGLGGAFKATARALKLAKTVAEAEAILRAAKVSEKAVQDYKLFFAKETNISNIESTLKTIAKEGKPVLTPTPTKTPVGSAGQNERTLGFLRSVQEDLPGLSVKGGSYTVRPTSSLATKAANFVRDDIVSAETFARTGRGEAATAVGSELLKHYETLAKNFPEGSAGRIAIGDKSSEIAHALATRLNAEGRSIQAASIIARLTPEGQIRFLTREITNYNIANPKKKIPNLSGKEVDEISSEMRAIQSMADGEEKAIRFKQLQDKMKARIPSSLIDKIVTAWKAGLLTGLKTTGLNILSTLVNAGAELGKDIPAAGADALLSLLTGKRTVTMTGKGVLEGTKEGIEKGWRYFKTGYDSRDVAAKLDYKQVNFKNKYIQGYVDTVFRALGAQDQVAYYGALKHSLYSQAAADAKNLGLKGKEAEEFITNKALNPTEEMSSAAVADAEMAVFQNETILSGAGSAIQKNFPGGGFILPFVRTPSAVAMQIVNYSPIGVVSEVAKQALTGKFDQRKLAQAFGRTAVGAPVIWLGSELFDNDRISLSYPKTERERELWKIEGRKENSIKVGNEWRSAATFGPLGPALLMGGHFKKALAESGSPTNAIIQAAFGTLKSFNEQTFVKGLNTVLEAIMDPERNAEYVASNFVSSFIPTIVSDVARAIDPKERRIDSTELTKKVWDGVKARIPGARQTLEPQVTVLGEERDSVGNPLEILLDPTRPSKQISSPVIDELRRLYDNGQQVSPTLLGDKNGYKSLTKEENTKLWKRAGEITNQKLGSLFSKESYQNLSEEEKGKVTANIIEKSTIAARAELVLEITRGLEGDELRKKLSELKSSSGGGTGKVLTEEVFRLYMQLR